jgi:acyl carrier protein
MRVELGEIENGLRAGLQQEAAYAEVVDGVLVGFVQGEVQEDWREALRAWLPQGWIPGRLVSVAAWPLNTNGKLDRQALCALARRERPEERYDAPQTDLEREIAEIWSEVLGRDSIGRTANFFDLGGHSLLATQLLSRLCERFHLEIGLQTLFEQVTVMQLAKHIQVIRQAEEDALQQGSDDEALEEIDI